MPVLLFLALSLPILMSSFCAHADANGQSIYEQHCIVCHEDGVAGAPRFQNEKDWQSRSNKNMDEFLASAMKGINAMPAKGTCEECGESDIKAAIEYMVPNHE